MASRKATRARVLIVDDDPDTRAMSTSALHDAYEAVCAASELRSLLGHCAHLGWARFSRYAVTYTSTSTSAPCTRTG